MLQKKLQDSSHLAKCKKSRTLPENVHPQMDHLPDDKFAIIAHHTYFVYLLADICYSEMFNLSAEMLEYSADLRQDSKKKFNEFMQKMQEARRAASRVGIDIPKFLAESRVDGFTDLSEYLHEVYYAVYNRVFTGKDIPLRMKCVIENFPEFKKEQIIQDYLNNKKHD